MTKFLWHKILLSFFPVLLITQNVAWITINKNLGITFLIALLVVVGLVWSKNSKAEVSIASHSISKWFSLLLPISVLIMTVVASSKITEEIWDSTAGQAWAIIWTGFAALIGTFIAIIVGVVLFIIFHALQKSAEKKSETSNKVKCKYCKELIQHDALICRYCWKKVTKED